MAEEKPKVPEYITTYESLKKKAKKIGDTADLAHSEAYVTAANAVLRDKEGNIDYEMLEKADIQEKFADKMRDHYLSKANQFFRANIQPKDKLELDMLLRAYSGITLTQLKRILKVHGKEYDLQMHERNKQQYLKEVKQQLTESAAGHLTDEHVPGLVKHMGLEKIVDSTKMKLEDVLMLHNIYESNEGDLSPAMIKQAYKAIGQPEPYYLIKKKKPEAKDK